MIRTYIALDNLRGFSAGIHYFDDDKNIYVAPEVLEGLKKQTLPQLRTFRLYYNRKDRPIEAIATEIINELKSCPPGAPTDAFITEWEDRKTAEGTLHLTPDIVVNPHTRLDNPAN